MWFTPTADFSASPGPWVTLTSTRTTASHSSRAVCERSCRKTIFSASSVSAAWLVLVLINPLTSPVSPLPQSDAVTYAPGSTLSNRFDGPKPSSASDARTPTTSRSSVYSPFRLTWDLRPTGDFAESFSSRPTASRRSEGTFRFDLFNANLFPSPPQRRSAFVYLFPPA